MLEPNKRQSELLNIIRDRSSMYVNDLIPMFNVSAATIRKDLTQLAEMNYIRRTHGEVHIVANTAITPIEHRSTQNIEAKQAIAKAAFSLIQEGSSIILDSGTTMLELAKLVASMNNLTVVTNSLLVAMALANTKVSVLMSGGMLLGMNLSMQGPDTQRYFENLEVDIAFLAASGVRPQMGVATHHPMEHIVKQAMMKAGRHVCVMADASKFEKSGLHLYSRFDELDTVITDTRVENTILHQLDQEEKVRWIIADEC